MFTTFLLLFFSSCFIIKKSCKYFLHIQNYFSGKKKHLQEITPLSPFAIKANSSSLTPRPPQTPSNTTLARSRRFVRPGSKDSIETESTIQIQSAKVNEISRANDSGMDTDLDGEYTDEATGTEWETDIDTIPLPLDYQQLIDHNYKYFLKSQYIFSSALLYT